MENGSMGLQNAGRRRLVEIGIIVLILIVATILRPATPLIVTLDSGMLLLDAPGQEDAWFKVEEMEEIHMEDMAAISGYHLMSGTETEQIRCGRYENPEGESCLIYCYLNQEKLICVRTAEDVFYFNADTSKSTQNLYDRLVSD